ECARLAHAMRGAPSALHDLRPGSPSRPALSCGSSSEGSMNAATVILFIFVSHDPTSHPPDGVVSACVRALPEGTRAVIRSASEAPPDAAVLTDAGGAGAVAAVVVSWDDPDRLSAQVRVATGLAAHVAAHVRWES